MQRKFTFSIGSIAHTYRQLFVGGDVIDGVVAVGDRFSSLRHRFDDEKAGPGEVEEAEEAVDLVVARILFYGKYVNKTSAPYAVEIEFSGDFAVRLAPWDVLTGESQTAAPQEIEVLGRGVQHVLSM
jgi:hypothetical protein